MSHRFIYLSITSSLWRSASAVKTRNWFCRSNPSTSKINYIRGVPPQSRRVIGFARANPRHSKSTIFTRRRSASAVDTRSRFCRSNPSTSKINYIHGGVPPQSRRVVGFAEATLRHSKSTIITRRWSASAVDTRSRFCKGNPSTF